jgi:hypothetical protein
MTGLHAHHSEVVAAILTRAGFEIRNNRATCPFCEGHSRFTVAIRGELYFCHRCHRGGSVRSLAREQGMALAPPRSRKANVPKAAFRTWLLQKMTELGDEERRAYRKYLWAVHALSFCTEFQPAWESLAWFYSRRRVWETFWESASDRVGRYWLYRAWRKHYEE